MIKPPLAQTLNQKAIVLMAYDYAPDLPIL